tara:strand:+ start:3491 stop:4372 length:882 start_codon:yes stop_codon:yes gene_type:complete
MVQVSYSTYGFPGGEFEPTFEQIAEIGFECVEFACDRHGVEDHPLEIAADVKRALDHQNLTATTVHAPARRNVLGAPDNEWRTQAIAVLADALRLTGEIGARGLVIHGIPNPMFLPQDQDMRSFYTEMVDAMRRSVEDLIPVAEQAGVRILLENLPYNWDLRAAGRDGDYPLMHVEDLRAFIEPFPFDQVGLIVDVGHSWTNGQDPASEILAAGNRLWGTHLQDVDRDDPQDNHWAPLQGGLDWPSILKAIEEVNYAGAHTFEIIRPRHDETAEELARMTFSAAQSWGLVSTA